MVKGFFESLTQYFSKDLIKSIKRILKFLIIYTIGFFILVIGIKYAIPFVIALLIAMGLKPLKNKILELNKNFKVFRISEGFISLILTVIIVAIAAGILSVIGIELVNQLRNFYSYITSKETLNLLTNDASLWIKGIFKSMDNVDPEILAKLSEIVTKAVSVIMSLVSTFVQNLLNLIVSIPTAVIMVLITIIATFFFTKDIDKILKKIKWAFSDKGIELIRKIRVKKNEIFGGYLKAYSIIMIVVGIYSLIIFKIAGIKYAVSIAIITALLDALPLFGAGFVYGIIAISNLFAGNIKVIIIFGFGYIGAVVIRQYLEQVLVSSFLGVHPLVVILGLFLVLTPLGFIGMFYFLGAFLLYEVIYPSKEINNMEK